MANYVFVHAYSYCSISAAVKVKLACCSWYESRISAAVKVKLAYSSWYESANKVAHLVLSVEQG